MPSIIGRNPTSKPIQASKCCQYALLMPHMLYCAPHQVYLDNGVYADFVVPWPPATSSSDVQPKDEAADSLERAPYCAASTSSLDHPTSSSAPISASSTASAPHQSPSTSLSPRPSPKVTTNNTTSSRSNNDRFTAVLLEGPECSLGNRSGVGPSSEVRRRLLERSGYLVLIIASADWADKISSQPVDRAAFLSNQLHSISSSSAIRRDRV